MHGSLGFMVNNHPTLRLETEDKGGYHKLTYIMKQNLQLPVSI